MSKELYKKTYNYNLPKELIAQDPVEPRDHSRLLVYDKAQKKMKHEKFYNIINHLNKGDVLVINRTKVIPARLMGVKEETGAKIEVLLLKNKGNDIWEIICKPLKKVKVGTNILFGNKLRGLITKIFENGNLNIQFSYIGVFESIIEEVGAMPLPHYIKKKSDKDRYQTVFAKELGSSAAPTAGLHFTKDLMSKIEKKGIIICDVLLHIGLGTFRPVSDENILNHNMHSEYYEITGESAEIINHAKKRGNKIVSVGTTSIRVLESAATDTGLMKESKGDTDIFIYPGYKFKVVDAIITNFHLPESTLIMLVSAFCGIEETLNMYKKAVEMKYRFYSFGDATFIK